MFEGCCSFSCLVIGLVILLVLVCIGLVMAFLFNSFGYGSVNALFVPGMALMGALA